MTAALAYYNEFDPAAAAWLRNLIACGLIAPGVVDTRSITEVQPDDLIGFTQVHLFAGIGGWSRAARLAGWPDARPIWSASCPCQPFSVAGKGAGRDDPRHLWPHVIRLAGPARPAVLVGEQVAGKAGYDWFDGVAADLEASGYACRAVDVPACAVDAPHIRSRQYWVAVAGNVADANEPVRRQRHEQPAGQFARHEQDAGIRLRAGSGDAGVGNLLDNPLLGGTLAPSGKVSTGRDGAYDADGRRNPLHVADSERHGGRPDLSGRRPEGRTVAGRVDGASHSGVALGDPSRLGRGEGRAEPEFWGGWAAAAGAASSGVTQGDACGPRLEGHSGDGSDRAGWAEPGGPTAEADGGAGIGHNSRAGTFWSDHEWLVCHDGKARRTQPGLPLLAHGLRGGVAVVRPDGLGIEGPEGFPALQEETRLISRIAAWKGFGNAIVPQLAAEVIGALKDVGVAQ